MTTSSTGPGEAPRPTEEFLQRWARMLGGKDDMAITLGLLPVFGDAEQVRLSMPLRPAISQPAGMFSAPALFGLADVSGTTLASYHAPEGTFPLAVQASISLVSNSARGHAHSLSRLVKAGRTLIVTTTDIFDDGGRVITKVDSTFFVSPPRKSSASS